MFATLAQLKGSGWIIPSGNSTFAPESDAVFWFITWMSVFFTVLIVGAIVYFAIRYRNRGDKAKHGTGPSHSSTLEITWTVIPALLVIAIFYYGFRGLLDMATPPENVYPVTVHGMQWSWSFEYRNGVVTSQKAGLVVPVDTPVQLTLQSTDVIHSFFVPQFRIKRDVVPGRYNKLWFQATDVGDYDIFCTQFCGQQHSQMTSKVHVLSKADFKAWMADQTKAATPAEAGEKLYHTKGCSACHSVDGAENPPIGPTWKDLFGHQVKLTNGQTVKADEAYIHESVRNPGAKVVAGHPNAMPPFPPSLLSDNDIGNIIAYMKSISKYAPKTIAPGGEATQPAAKTGGGGAAATSAATQPAK